MSRTVPRKTNVEQPAVREIRDLLLINGRCSHLGGEVSVGLKAMFERQPDIIQAQQQAFAPEGVDAMIDQYEPHPSEGWPKWMEKQMARNYLLIVLSPRFVEGFEQAETSMGGARYESVILSARLLRQGVNYSHTALAVFSSYDDRICSTPV